MVHRLKNPKVHCAKLIKRDKKRATEILQALASGMSLRECARQFKVSHHTISALEEDEATVASLMERTKKIARRIIRSGMEELQDVMVNGRLQASQVAWNTNATIDMLGKLEGAATTRVEVVHTNALDGLAAFAAAPKGLDASAIREIEATILSSSSDSESDAEDANLPISRELSTITGQASDSRAD